MASASMNTWMTAVSDPRTACSLTTRQNAEIWRHSVSRLGIGGARRLGHHLGQPSRHQLEPAAALAPASGSSAGSASAITAARSGFDATIRAIAMRRPSKTSTRDCPVATHLLEGGAHRRSVRLHGQASETLDDRAVARRQDRHAPLVEQFERGVEMVAQLQEVFELRVHRAGAPINTQRNPAARARRK